MKKIIAILLMLALALTVVACGKKADENTDNDAPAVEDTAEDTADDTTEDTADTPVTDGTVGTTLAAEFKSAAEADTALTAEDLANTLATSATVSAISPVTMPVEEGFLTGFDSYEVKAFSEGVMFAPMIGTIPFVGYVFTIADGVDAETFASELEANANPRWNICTEAEETVTEVVGNKVFFVMCPMSFETSEEPTDDMGMDMGIDEGIPAYDGEEVAE